MAANSADETLPRSVSEEAAGLSGGRLLRAGAGSSRVRHPRGAEAPQGREPGVGDFRDRTGVSTGRSGSIPRTCLEGVGVDEVPRIDRGAAGETETARAAVVFGGDDVGHGRAIVGEEALAPVTRRVRI